MSDPLHGSKSHLPKAMFLLAPELRSLELPEEATSDCSACPMLRQPDDPDEPARFVFTAPQRCCTFNPSLYNFQAGRALRRGGVGAERVRKRIGEATGVTPWAIHPPKSFYKKYFTDTGDKFGRDPSLRCPYWVDGPLSCSIWEDRNAVCRSWFCKHEAGHEGRNHWNAYKRVLHALEVRICRWLVDIGEPPRQESATTRSWCRFYMWCADRLDQATIEDLRTLQDEHLLEDRKVLRQAHAAITAETLPDKVGPAVGHVGQVDEDHVLLVGYSAYNPGVWPRTIFTLFSKMDGTVTWREALDLAEDDLGERAFDEADIRELFRLGILEARRPEDLIPGARVGGRAAFVAMDVSKDGVSLEWSYDDEGDGEVQLTNSDEGGA